MNLVRISPTHIDDQEHLRQRLEKLELVDPEGKGVWMLCTDANLRKIGLGHRNMETLRRLAWMGEIRMARISPGLTVMDLQSWAAHVARTSEDPYYWDNGERMRNWRYLTTARRKEVG